MCKCLEDAGGAVPSITDMYSLVLTLLAYTSLKVIAENPYTDSQQSFMLQYIDMPYFCMVYESIKDFFVKLLL